MGTNYYVETNVCEHCGRGEEELHIGKSSAGWVFSLHVMPEDGIKDLKDWKKFWKGKTIKDEYSREIKANEMIEIITKRNGGEKEKVPYGYPNWATFHLRNSSEPGPKNLLRHKIDGRCIGHGSGTWDLIQGEFS